MASKIYYTHTDEAPALATKSFLPIVQAFAKQCPNRGRPLTSKVAPAGLSHEKPGPSLFPLPCCWS